MVILGSAILGIVCDEHNLFWFQEFEPRVSLQQSNTLIVAIVFSNLSSSQTVKSLEFNVLDSMNTKLIRQVSYIMRTADSVILYKGELFYCMVNVDSRFVTYIPF